VTDGTSSFPWPTLLLGIATAALAVLTVVVGDHTPTNLLATSLLQAFTFSVGVLAAYAFAKASAVAAARDLIRGHASPAFRRQRGLYKSIGRVIDEIDLQMSTQKDEKIRLNLRILRGIIVEQLEMSGDALDDWRDLVPDEVAELEQQKTNSAQE
jgi:hypothetical protein